MSLPRIALPTLLLLPLAVGCAKPMPERSPIATEPIQLSQDEWRVTDQVIVVTDGSGTMYVNETFPDAKALTRSFIEALPATNAPAANSGNYGAGVIGFGGDERETAPLGAFDRGRLAATASNLTIMGDVSGRGGTTPYAAVLREIASELSGKRGRAAVVFFSDGVPDDAAAAMAAGKRLAAGYRDGVCFHGVHTGTDPEGYEFLKRLSGLTSCGSVRAASAVGTSFEVQQLARAVTVGPADLPPVAAGPGPCAGVVRLRGIEFAFDRSEIRSDSRPVLDVAVEQLNRCPDIRVTISGHTDAVGTEPYNVDLSYRRAQATKQYLVDSGVDARRLEVEGLGEANPVAPNDTVSGRAQNRRVELAPTR